MNKRLFALALVVPLLFAVGCASAGIKKPTVFVDQHNGVPADIPSQFLARYERFVTGKESKEFKKLLTDEERQVFIDKFWLERDTDPSTPENERKQEVDGYIDDIASERFLSTPGVFGLSFQTNGGFRGDMAHVYLLYGEPDAMDTVEGQRFVNLMLWIYVDEQSGEILYAFLFFQRGSMGAFSLFSQDAYKLDPCGAVNQIRTLGQFSGRMSECAPDTESILQELYTATGKGGVIDGYVFAWALFNFSQDGSITQGKALEPPKTASELARQSKARVTGEAPELVGEQGTDYILASCPECDSLIPAELQWSEGEIEYGFGKALYLSIRRGDIDWRVVGDQAEVELKERIVFESQGQKPLVFEDTVIFKDKKELVVSDPAGRVSILLLNVDSIPAGNYGVSVYVKNVTPGLMTKKYNAWFEEFTKP